MFKVQKELKKEPKKAEDDTPIAWSKGAKYKHLDDDLDAIAQDLPRTRYAKTITQKEQLITIEDDKVSLEEDGSPQPPRPVSKDLWEDRAYEIHSFKSMEVAGELINDVRGIYASYKAQPNNQLKGPRLFVIKPKS